MEMNSYWKGLVDSVSSLFSTLTSAADDPPRPPGMEGVVGLNVVSERVAHKLKGYFELAKEFIDKAVRAEEWGLTEEAIGYYQNAEQVLLEGKATRAPASLSSRFNLSALMSFGNTRVESISWWESEEVNLYHEKISKWHKQVSERLKVLGHRSARTSVTKTGLTHSRNKAASSSVSSAKNTLQRKPIHTKATNKPAGNFANNVGGAKPIQETGSSYDAKLVEMINTAIVDRSPSVKWEDVAGLDKAKQALLEMVILPTKRRDLFTGLRKPARGLLLFGPPGNGKTMLAKAVASESDATFFNVSASSLTSKWVGEAEKLVKTLFVVAVSRQPSVIFIDEIDSIMSTRLTNENDASRRLKSEFLVQFDGVTSNPNDLVIVIGATNKPHELDDAVLRRLVKRIYIPLPDENVRRLLLKNQLKGQAFSLPDYDLQTLVKETEGYSGSDLQALCEEAAMMPIRELGSNILTVKANQVRPLKYRDFQNAMTVIRPSLVKSKWEELEQWNREFGSN